MAALVLLAPLGLEAREEGGGITATIYGRDDRYDLYQVSDPNILKLADSTVAIFWSRQVAANGQTALLDTTAWTNVPNGPLCPEERFYQQPGGAWCSGALVAPDIVMTAGHCVTSQSECGNEKFVFGFSLRHEGDAPSQVPASEVYSCARLIASEKRDGADWALVQLDRPAAGHEPLALSRTPVANGTPVFVIGYPAGLPAKVAGTLGAAVRDASPSGYFVVNTDTYSGNSGSPVFNARTGAVEGVLARGDKDFELKNGCYVSKVCPADGCQGESVTKISAVRFPQDQLDRPEHEGTR